MNINKIINLADKLDQMGHYKEAGLLDKMMEGVSGLFSGKDSEDDGLTEEPKEEEFSYAGDFDQQSMTDKLYTMLNSNIDTQVGQYGYEVNKGEVLEKFSGRFRALVTLLLGCTAITSANKFRFEVKLQGSPVEYGRAYQMFDRTIDGIIKLYSRLIDGPGKRPEVYDRRLAASERLINRGAVIDELSKIISKSPVFAPMLINTNKASIDSSDITPKMIKDGEDYSKQIKEILVSKYDG
jgi:hypothetical protein